MALCVSSFTSPSLSDLSHIPLNILKRATKRSFRTWCCPSLNTHHPSPSHPVHTGVGFSLGVQQRHRGPNKETALLSTGVYVLLFWHFFPCGVKADKGWLMASKLLETVVWAPVFVQASNVASFSTWRPAPDIISPVGRNGVTQQPGECDGGIYLSAPFWRIQAERKFIISAWLAPLPLIKYLPWCNLPNMGNICIPNKWLNIDDTKDICSFLKANFSQQIVNGPKTASFFECLLFRSTFFCSPELVHFTKGYISAV